MFAFKKLIAVFLVVFLGVSVSGCAAVGFVGGNAYMAAEAEKFTGVVEIGEVKIKSSVNITLLKTAKISSAVFEKNMTTISASPHQHDIKVNITVTEEIRRSLGATGGVVSPVTFRLKTFYYNEGWFWGYYYYESITEKNTLTRSQKYGVQKAINIHLFVEKGNDVLLEVHGLWGGNDRADEIAGAKKLAQAMVQEILKKLGSPVPQGITTEAKKE